MALPYVELLTHELEASVHLRSLAPSLEHTRTSVAAWWRGARLHWFTDHAESHSERVAEKAFDIASTRELPAHLTLNLMERYLLEMAAWVHDIGMQSLVPADAPSDPDFSADPDVVRKEHARYSHQLLVRKIVTTGIPDAHDDVLECIAQLALAHGTKTYAEAVDVLRAEFPAFPNYTVRGPLLAAILLMADELDLPADRVREAGGPRQIGVVSHAHYLKHECITATKLAEFDRDGSGKLVQIRLSMKRFANMSDEQFDILSTWVTDKLTAQIAMTEREFAEGFDRCFTFDKVIDVSEPRQGRTQSSRVSDGAFALMSADNLRNRLINHSKCVRRSQKVLRKHRPLILTGIDPRSDHSTDVGREDLFAFLTADARSRAWRVGTVGASRSSRPLSDNLFTWARDLTWAGAEGEREHEIQRRERALELLQPLVAGSTEPVLLALSTVDVMDDSSREWLFGKVVPVLRDAGAQFVFTAQVVPGEADGWSEVSMEETDPAELTSYLAKYYPRPIAEALVARGGVTYASARALTATGAELAS